MAKQEAEEILEAFLGHDDFWGQGLTDAQHVKLDAARDAFKEITNLLGGVQPIGMSELQDIITEQNNTLADNDIQIELLHQRLSQYGEEYD